jgi:SAM-dependent methyltransferase
MNYQGSKMNCIVCTGTTRAGLSPWHHTCPSCSYESAQLQPMINEQQAHDQLNERDREIALKQLRSENFKTIVEHIGQLAAPGAKKLLDVGSAHGWFLEQAATRFEVMGVEPDAAVGGKAAARGLPVRLGYFPDALANGETFDVIVFNDVIEHIPDIKSALDACKARLNPAGLLVLNLPSSRGFFYRLSKLFASVNWSGPFDRMWQKGLPSPHVHYFNDSNLTTLVTRHGFTVARTFDLAALSTSGLLERLRLVGKVNPVALYLQYAAVMCAIPLVKLFPSDIVVCVFRKQA